MADTKAAVATVRKELKDKLPIYQMIADCIEGQEAVKKAGDKYLPRPNASDRSEDNLTRYAAYLLRAVFYNVTNRTLEGLMGEVFFRDPEVELPESMKAVQINANGKGLDLMQLSKQASKDVLAFGRIGVLTDYPVVDRIPSKKDIEDNHIYPTINVYKPWNCVNWRTKVVGAKTVLSLVVLKETKEKIKNDFEVTLQTVYRVLKLTDANVYIQEMWEPKGEKNYEANVYTKTSTITPRDSKAQPLNEIPFLFVGSSDNDVSIDTPPMYDMSVLNIAHYRNSADYEEACYITGQPTYYFAGLTQNWITTVFKDEPIQVGSRAAIPLPSNATAGILQATANSMPYEAMQQKKEQMVEIGAKLIGEATIEKTATEVSIESSSETSILSSVIKNISSGFERALRWGALLAGSDPQEVSFKLNDDFKVSTMTAEDRRMLLDEWIGGAISWLEYRENLRRNGIATKSDEDVLTDIEKEQKKRTDIENQAKNQQNKVD